jgi:hypothetical protein
MDAQQATQGNANGQPAPAGRNVNPQPGRHAVTQKVVLTPTAGEYGWFVHDMTIPVTLADTIARRLHPNEERLNNDFMLFDAFKERVRKHIFMLMARKLSNSLSEEQQLEFGGFLKNIANMQCHGLSGVAPLIDLFGCVEEDGLKFSMIAQPILAFSYFARAVLAEEDAIEANLENSLFVNTRWPIGKKMLYESALAIINTWARAEPPRNFQFGNAQVVSMTVPEVRTNVTAYSAFVNHIEKPGIVVRMLNIAIAIEPFLNVAVPQQQLDQLRAQQVFFVDWNSASITAKGEVYSDTVESRLRMPFQTASNWVPISAFKSKGSQAQLLMKGTEHIFYCPVELSAKSMDLGWMMASQYGYISINQKGYHVVPFKTQKHGMVSYVEGLIKFNF